jgi:hypothetical protein
MALPIKFIVWNEANINYDVVSALNFGDNLLRNE